jgi:hypothetical protein
MVQENLTFFPREARFKTSALRWGRGGEIEPGR